MSSDENDGVRELHPSDSPFPNSTIQIRLGEPLPDAEYNTPEDVLQAYQDHSKLNGYGVVFEYERNRKKKGKIRINHFDRGGKYRDRNNPNLHESKRRGFKKNGETRTRKAGCKEFHNHEVSDDPVNHSANRTKALNENPEAKRSLISHLSRNSSVSSIRAELLNTWQIEVTQRDIYKISQSLRNL
ncbi:hypothetical protein GcM1_181005 [Golovinomyces cichoracearum]|uniref:Uncharacterized protein n=1 Tax=Golovinomyces cichoracearum TaxID=62708 RepID=A0A420J420_9PEZI|nr:hypothetical protein GcM1_181005 [Golovinomyces cichoracearum]